MRADRGSLAIEAWFRANLGVNLDNNSMNAKPPCQCFLRIFAGRSQAPILPATILLESR